MASKRKRLTGDEDSKKKRLKRGGISDSSLRASIQIPTTPPGLTANQRKNWRRQQRRLALKKKQGKGAKDEDEVEVVSRTELGGRLVKRWEGDEGSEDEESGDESMDYGSVIAGAARVEESTSFAPALKSSVASIKEGAPKQQQQQKDLLSGSHARPKGVVEQRATGVPAQSAAKADPEAGLKRLSQFLGEGESDESEDEEEDESGSQESDREEQKTPRPRPVSTVPVAAQAEESDEDVPVEKASGSPDITQVPVADQVADEQNDHDESTSASDEDSVNGELRAVESQQSFRPSEEAESDDDGVDEADAEDDDLMRDALSINDRNTNGAVDPETRGHEEQQDSNADEESDAEAKALGEIRIVRERSSPDMRRQLIDEEEHAGEAGSKSDSEAASSLRNDEEGNDDEEEEEEEEEEGEAEPAEPDLSQSTPRSSSRWSFLGQRPGGEHSRHSRRRTDDERLVFATASSEVLNPPSQQNSKTNQVEESKENVSPQEDGGGLLDPPTTTPRKKYRRDEDCPLGSQLSTPPDSREKTRPGRSRHTGPQLEVQDEGPGEVNHAFPLYDSFPDTHEIPPTPKSTSKLEPNCSPCPHTGQQSPEHDESTPARKKRKMTGITSKHFSLRQQTRSQTKITGDECQSSEPEAQSSPNEPDSPASTSPNPAPQAENDAGKDDQGELNITPRRKAPKRTSTKSNYFLPLDRVDLPSPSSRPRIPGVSHAPIPPISSPQFGIIQEKLASEPFWLLVAVILLNKTTGRAAIPTFWELRKKYGSVEGLANADVADVSEMIYCCGLYNQRGRGIVGLARGWAGLGKEGAEAAESEGDGQPRKGTRFRCLHYPSQGDGKRARKAKKKKGKHDDNDEEVVDVVSAEVEVEDDGGGDKEQVKGFLEIAHLKGCGRYAYDSWRIFCRDVLRGVATGYNGEGREGDDTFEPEWTRVLPQDKELRATVRWMWLREGWIWDCETGEKRRATDEEMERARKGEMDVPDGDEKKFAERAMGVAS